MPKIKSHRGVMKRFRRTKSGKIKRNHAYTGHLKVGKSATRKRRLRGSTLVSKSDIKRISRLMPGGS